VWLCTQRVDGGCTKQQGGVRTDTSVLLNDPDCYDLQ